MFKSLNTRTFFIIFFNIKDWDYNNLIIFLRTVNELNSSKSEYGLNKNNDKGNNDNNDIQNKNSIKKKK